MVAFAAYSVMLVPALGLGLVMDRPAVLVAVFTVPAMIVWRSWPPGFAGAMIVGGTIARVALVGTGGLTDQIETTQAAAQLVLTGGNPYGHGIAGTSTGAPFPYGPLALAAYLPGVWTEIAASLATMIVLYRCRALVTLAVFAVCPFVVRAAIMGLNDVLPALMILVALLAVRRTSIGAAVLLAIAVAIKPYAVAWVPSLIGLGGLQAAAAFLVMSAAAWSPLLLWGPGSYLRSLQLVVEATPQRVSGLGVPMLRILALPLGLAALVVPSWRVSVTLGCGIFFLLMFSGNFSSGGYLLPPLLVLCVAIESPLVREAVGVRPLLGSVRTGRQAAA